MLLDHEESRLMEIFSLCQSRIRDLNRWEREFTQSLAERYEEEGPKFFMSQKMWALLTKIEEKLEK